MKLKGPVLYTKYEFEGRHVRILSDLHNSVEGGCCEDCLDYNDNYEEIGSDNSCYSLPRYLDNMFKKNRKTNFYFESPFVLCDSSPNPRPKLTQLDYIDQLTAVFDLSLKQNKSLNPYMPNAHIHYCDIRDVYNRPYNGSIRKPQSVNPFSGAWLSNVLQTKEDFEEGIYLLSYILKNVNAVKDMFLTSNYQIPKLYMENRFFPLWYKRVCDTKLLTSQFNGKTVHRVAKQLLKLDSKTRQKVLEWSSRRFEEEKRTAIHGLNNWKNIVRQTSNSKMYQSIVEAPIMIMIPMSSVIMDTYLIARLLYQKSDSDIIFAGRAHTDSYLEFFNEHGTLLKQSSGNERSKRCLILESADFS